MRYNLTVNQILVDEAIPAYSSPGTASAVDDSSLVQMYRLYHPKLGHAGAALCPAFFARSPKHAVITAYERAIRDHVTAFIGASREALGDGDAQAWLSTLQRWVPELPLSPALCGEQAWIDVLTALLTRITVVHSTQHHALAAWDNIAERPLRMRRPPPAHAGDMPKFPLTAYQWKVDQFQACLFQKTVVEPVGAPALQDVQYAFVNRPDLDALAARFREALSRLAQQYPTLIGPAPLRVYQGVFV